MRAGDEEKTWMRSCDGGVEAIEKTIVIRLERENDCHSVGKNVDY